MRGTLLFCALLLATASASAQTPLPRQQRLPMQAAPVSPATPVAPGGEAGQVWVKTSSKVYHCQGDRYYGNTKRGGYMTEAAARAAGDRPSHGKACGG